MTNPFLQGIASGLHSYAQGGIIPAPSDTMPNMNGYYPLSNIQRTDAAYDPKLSFAHPSELLGSGDTNIDPFTGEEKFDEGGAVAMREPMMDNERIPQQMDDGSVGGLNPFDREQELDNPFPRLTWQEQPDDNSFFNDIRNHPEYYVQQPPTPVSGPSGPNVSVEYDHPYADDSWLRPPPAQPAQPFNPLDVERQPQPAQPDVQPYNTSLPQERGPIGRQPWIRPPDTYHPLPALTGGIGPYVDQLNRDFAAAPRYKDNAGIDWTSGGGSYVGGTGTGGGGGGGGGGDGGGGIGIGPNTVLGAYNLYKNWPAIKAGWNKLTGKPPTGLTPEEQALYDQNQKTQTPTELKTAPTVAGTTALVGSQLENLFAAQPTGSVEAIDDVTNGTGQTASTPLTTDFSGLGAAGAAAAGTGISSLLNGPTGSVEAIDDVTNGTGQTASTSGANLSGLGGSAAGALANTVGSRTGQILVGDAADFAGDAVGSLGGEAASNAASTATSGAGKGILSGAGNAISNLKAIVGGDSTAGRLMVGDAGKITNLANLPGNLASAGLSYLGSKLAGNKAGSIGSSLGSMVLGPIGSAAGSILGTMFGGFTGIGSDPDLIANPFTGEMIHAYSDEGKALRAAQNSDSYKASDLPSGPYGSLGMTPEAGYYAKQNQMRDLASQMAAAGYSGYDKYKNVNVNDLPASKAAGSNWTPGAGPDYSGGNIADFTPDQLETVKKFAPEYYRSLTNPTTRSANTDAEMQKSLEAQLATEGRREPSRPENDLRLGRNPDPYGLDSFDREQELDNPYVERQPQPAQPEQLGGRDPTDPYGGELDNYRERQPQPAQPEQLGPPDEWNQPDDDSFFNETRNHPEWLYKPEQPQPAQPAQPAQPPVGTREEPVEPSYEQMLADYYNQLYAGYGFAAGGLASLPEYKAGGLLRGPGDGMSDSIPAVIKGQQPQRAALADGEFVVPADVVSHLGNGSTKAGSARLYEMMDKIRHARTGNSKQGKKINPHKFLPV